MRTPDVMGPAEAATLLGVSRQRMHQLQRTDPEFPAATCLSIGKVWDAPMMRAYGRDRLTGNNRHRAFLQHYYTHANLTAACRHAGITKNTGYRWLEKLGGVRASAR